MQRARGLVMQAARLQQGRVVNWGSIIGSTRPANKAKVVALKNDFENLVATVNGAPTSEPVLDLSKYKTSAQATDLANFFEDQVNNKLSLTASSADAEVSKIQARIAELRKMEAVHLEEVESNIANIDSEIAKAEATRTTKDTSVLEVLERDSTLEDKIEEKLRAFDYVPPEGAKEVDEEELKVKVEKDIANLFAERERKLKA